MGLRVCERVWACVCVMACVCVKESRETHVHKLRGLSFPTFHHGDESRATQAGESVCVCVYCVLQGFEC